MMCKVTILVLLLDTLTMAAQNSFTISGTITDIQNGEHLVGVTIYDSLSGKGTFTNNYGFYSLSIPNGDVRLKYSTIGYLHQSFYFLLARDTSINLQMNQSLTELNEVVVTEKRRSYIQTGVISMKTTQIKSAPVLLGEADVLKTMQLLPGVKSGTEGTSGLYVRGGSPDQNLILLDGVPVYNSSHAFGFFSIFNPDAISGFSFYKGGIPARYAGRISSVLDLKMKEGNNQKMAGKASLGLIASNFMIEGPIFGEKTSFFISGRRTFIDLLTKPFQPKNSDPVFPDYSFFDLNGKINHRLNYSNRIYASIYLGKDHNITAISDKSQDDKRSYKYKDGFGWGNLTSSVRWNSILSKKLFSNMTLIFSKYKFSIYRNSEELTYATKEKSYNHYNYLSGIYDLGGKWDIDWFPSPSHTIRTGLNFTYHTFNPGITLIKNKDKEQVTDIDTTFGSRTYVREIYFYAEDDFKITESFNASAGLNYSIFSVKDKYYTSLQPRLALSYAINQDLKIKSSYGIMSQYLHLLTNSTTGLPTDLWLPVTNRIRPQSARQYAIGLEYNISSSHSISIEGYTKKMSNLIDYKEGASFFKLNGSWEDQVEIGNGHSKGIELLLQKEQGKTTGWVGITVSKTMRQFSNLNNGQPFPYRYDRRLDIGVMAIHKFNDRIKMSCSWVFGTGNRITLPTEIIRTFIGDKAALNISNSPTFVKNITSINNFLTPSYHRLDLGIEFLKKKRLWTRILNFGVYNAYNRLNPFYIYADLLDNPPVLKQVSIFPVMPYVKYSVNF